ncbi:MAG: hypothetical protein F6K22_34615 [Okeania sp. SIO2F4]|nr:hypothetical protein [Okeania sp. SIO2F4]
MVGSDRVLSGNNRLNFPLVVLEQKKPPPIMGEAIYQGASTFSFSHIYLLTPEIINLIFHLLFWSKKNLHQ